MSDNTVNHRSTNNFYRGWGGALYDKDKNTLEGVYSHAKIFVQGKVAITSIAAEHLLNEAEKN